MPCGGYSCCYWAWPGSGLRPRPFRRSFSASITGTSKSGSNALTNPNTALTNDLRKADLRWIRIGGARFDDVLWQNPASYVAAISYARSLGAEPIVQVPIKLTKTQLSSFICYFASHNITVTYWAIGNEQDPADIESTTTFNEPLQWSAGNYSNQYGYTYDQWIVQYKGLAIRLKNDLPNCKLVGPDFRLFYPEVMNDFTPSSSTTWARPPTSTPPPTSSGPCSTISCFTSTPTKRRRTSTPVCAAGNAGGQHHRQPRRQRLCPAHHRRDRGERHQQQQRHHPGPGRRFPRRPVCGPHGQENMKQGGLCFTPWSIYESGERRHRVDYSLYASDAATPGRRSTMWHLAMLSNYRQANMMNGTKNAPTRQRGVRRPCAAPTATP